jgi:hypothetical protein
MASDTNRVPGQLGSLTIFGGQVKKKTQARGVVALLSVMVVAVAVAKLIRQPKQLCRDAQMRARRFCSAANGPEA